MAKPNISKHWHWPLFLALAVALLASGQDNRRQQARHANGGVRVFIDPVTGAIREPEQEELQSLLNSSPTTAATDTAKPQFLIDPSGAIGMLLGEDQMVYSVATIGADGKLKMESITGNKNAKRKVEAASAKEAADVR